VAETRTSDDSLNRSRSRVHAARTAELRVGQAMQAALPRCHRAYENAWLVARVEVGKSVVDLVRESANRRTEHAPPRVLGGSRSSAGWERLT